MTMKIDWMRACATALVTPFMSDGSIDEPALTRLIEYQISNGVKVLVPCGTTGESATMTVEEHNRVVAICVDQAAGAGAGDRGLRVQRHANRSGAYVRGAGFWCGRGAGGRALL